MDKNMFIAVTVIGVFVLAGGIYLTYNTFGLLGRSITTTATVVNLQYSQEGMAYPVLQFTDKIGTRITVKLSEGRKPPAFTLGDEVSIIYDDDDPSNIRVNSLFGIWLAPIAMIFLGAVFSFVGFTNYWGSRQWA